MHLPSHLFIICCAGLNSEYTAEDYASARECAEELVNEATNNGLSSTPVTYFYNALTGTMCNTDEVFTSAAKKALSFETVTIDEIVAFLNIVAHSMIFEVERSSDYMNEMDSYYDDSLDLFRKWLHPFNIEKSGEQDFCFELFENHVLDYVLNNGSYPSQAIYYSLARQAWIEVLDFYSSPILEILDLG